MLALNGESLEGLPYKGAGKSVHLKVQYFLMSGSQRTLKMGMIKAAEMPFTITFEALALNHSVRLCSKKFKPAKYASFNSLSEFLKTLRMFPIIDHAILMFEL